MGRDHEHRRQSAPRVPREIARPPDLTLRFRRLVVSTLPSLASLCTSRRWHCRCSVVIPWGGRADASGHVALHATACVDHDLLGCSPAEQVALLGAMDPCWTVPSWLPCGVPIAAARPWKSS